MNKLQEALKLAYAVHQDQVDRAGKPYLFHVMTVMQNAEKYTDDEDILAACILHDSIEDSNGMITENDISAHVNPRVATIVRLVTKVDGETDDEYLAKVKTARESMIVKMADIEHNSDIRRLKGIRQKDMDRTIKYQKMYYELRALLLGVK